MNTFNSLRIILGLFLLIGLGWFGGSFWRLGRVDRHFKNIAAATTIPTVFVHGYRGNRYSFGRMLRRFQRQGVARKVIVVRIAKDGTWHLDGTWPQTPCNPCIQVLFQKNTASVQQQVHWLADLLAFFKANDKLATVNLVGHSMGAITVAAYCAHCFGPTQPRVQKVVTIAGPFNDLELGRDTPKIFSYPLTRKGPVRTTPIYEDLVAHMKRVPYPIDFLNIVGNILPTGKLAHDGSVATNSGLALKYVLQGTRHHYVQVLIRGAGAAHSLLHENSLVDWNVIDFLWGENFKNKS